MPQRRLKKSVPGVPLCLLPSRSTIRLPADGILPRLILLLFEAMIRRIHVSGYRSIRELCLELQSINVLTGPNGCGKSNLYNSLVLMGRGVKGELARAIAEEGGTPSIFWAGGERIRFQRKKPPKRVVLGFEAEDLAYEIQIGLPSFNEHALTRCSSSIHA